MIWINSGNFIFIVEITSINFKRFLSALLILIDRDSLDLRVVSIFLTLYFIKNIQCCSRRKSFTEFHCLKFTRNISECEQIFLYYMREKNCTVCRRNIFLNILYEFVVYHKEHRIADSQLSGKLLPERFNKFF